MKMWGFRDKNQKYASDPRPPHTRQKYEQTSGQLNDPKRFKTRQNQLFGRHIFVHISENAMGGVEKRGGWKTSRMTPLPKRGFGPPSYGTFSTPLRCQCSVFPVQKATTEQTRSSFGGVQKFSGECVLWYASPPPPSVLHPPMSRPKYFCRICGGWGFKKNPQKRATKLTRTFPRDLT